MLFLLLFLEVLGVSFPVNPAFFTVLSEVIERLGLLCQLFKYRSFIPSEDAYFPIFIE